MSKAYQYYGSAVANYIYCVLIDSAVLAVVSKNATKIGLVVITVERYVKVTRLYSENMSVM